MSCIGGILRLIKNWCVVGAGILRCLLGGNGEVDGTYCTLLGLGFPIWDRNGDYHAP